MATPSEQKPPTHEIKSQWLARFREDNLRHCRQSRFYENLWSWVRLIIFLAGVFTVYCVWANKFTTGTAGIVFIFIFLFAVRIHNHFKEKRKLLEWMGLIIEETIQRCGGKVTLIRGWEKPKTESDANYSLPPILPSRETWALSEREHDDLDLYSPPVGIFGLLNRTSTPIGERRLREWMDHSLTSIDEIQARQTGVRRLDESPFERFRIMAAMAPLRNLAPWFEQLITAVDRATPFPRPFLSRLFRIWSWPTAAFTLFALPKIMVGDYAYLVGVLWLLVFNGMLFLFIRRSLRQILPAWQNLGPTLINTLTAVRRAATDLPENSPLAILKQTFLDVLGPRNLPSLVKVQPRVDISGPIHALLNCLVFYDLHVAEAILRRVIPHRTQLLKSFSALAELEAYTSLACFAWEQPVACYPTPIPNSSLTLISGRHPLISPEQVVPNDVQIESSTRLWIITGPNAAGKSTLLRTVGVNILLAQMGGAVTAEKMAWSPVRLMTDLRVRDDLAIQESLFLSEVRHLRRMIASITDTVPLLGLIDEPFRGTNSREKLAASLALAEYLATLPHFFFLATHEHALTRLPENSAAVNYHFQETLSDAGLSFDYRLRPGPAQTTTALQIMKREGFPNDLLSRAHRWLENLPY